MQGRSDNPADENVLEDVNVPLMQDNSQREKDFEIDYTFRGFFHEKKGGSFGFIIYSASILFAALVGLVLTITGAWAIIQCTVFFPITTQASMSVIIISALVITVGVLMIAGIVGCVLYVKYERPSTSDIHHNLLIIMPTVFMFVFAVMLTALGIAAGALIPSLSERIGTSANNSLLTIHDSQGARAAWDTAQNTLRCCGAVNFIDYEQVFNNFSVPVSCCSTTNPLANETTCPDIVMDTNITDLIYTEGCVPHLVSYFHYILSVVAGVAIIVGAITIIGGLYALSLLGCFVGVDDCCHAMVATNKLSEKTYKYFPAMIGLILLFGLGFIAVAIWGLVQDLSFYYSITAPANANVSMLSVLLIIAGGLMISTCICQIAATNHLNWEIGTTKHKRFIALSCGEFWFVSLCVLPMVILPLVVGIVAAGMSGPTVMELSSTLHKYLDDQIVQNTWNDLQENMECCGVSNFTDYETVFNNFSVPVSCCNTSSPLASECPDIVRNSQHMINQTGLIYSDGCVSHLESFFNNIFSVIASVSNSIAGLQLAAVLIWLWCFSFVAIRIGDELDYFE